MTHFKWSVSTGVKVETLNAGETTPRVASMSGFNAQLHRDNLATPATLTNKAANVFTV